MKKKKSTKNDKVYIFRITLSQNSPYCQIRGIEEKIWRDIAVLGSQNLYNFAESIVDSFGFDFDHCFGFFDNLNSWTKSKVKYELFADLPDVEKVPGAKSVKKTKIQQAFKNKGDKMLFLFDYGDNWEFIIQLKDIEEANLKKSYSQIIESIGQAPEQYPALGE